MISTHRRKYYHLCGDIGEEGEGGQEEGTCLSLKEVPALFKKR